MKKYFYSFIIISTLSFFCESIFAQEGISKFEKWLSVGELQNWYSSIGCEREEDGPDVQQQAGWRWPAPYLNQDMQAAKGLWIGARNYTEPELGTTFDYKVVHCGPRPTTGGLVEFFPIEFTQYAKFNPSPVRVDGQNSFAYKNTVDVVDENLPYDQMIFNVVNTQMGVTMKRRIFQYSNEFHNNYIVIENTFINTGNIDKDADIERTSGDLEDVIFYYQYRMAPCRETRILIGNATAWGRNTLNDERGTHRSDPDNPENLRYQYAWHGYFKDFTGWNNVGGPIWETDGTAFGHRINEADTVGRLGAAQFPGVLTLHADNSVTDRTDDPAQPTTTGYFSSDHPLNFASNTFNPSQMQDRYNIMSAGHPNQSHAEFITGGDFAGSTANPGTGSTNDAGYSIVNGYGPYDIPYGDSIKVIIVEAAAGLSRDEAIRVGKLYKEGTITAVEKNEYVLQGRDSLHQTFKRVIADYQNEWKLDNEPPLPPKNFEVNSRGGRIDLTWDVYLQGSIPKGFEIYRSTVDPVDGYASNEYYSKYELAAALGPEERTFSDTAIVLNTAYYYYILAVGEDVPANAALNIPTHTLKSARLYTQTYTPAYKRIPGRDNITSDVRIYPNPYIVSAGIGLGFEGEDKIVFQNISGQCKIQIYSEIGELIQTLEHKDGSGSHDWFLTTSSNQFIVSGIYIAVITDDITGDREIAKFTIIL